MRARKSGEDDTVRRFMRGMSFGMTDPAISTAAELGEAMALDVPVVCEGGVRSNVVFRFDSRVNEFIRKLNEDSGWYETRKDLMMPGSKKGSEVRVVTDLIMYSIMGNSWKTFGATPLVGKVYDIRSKPFSMSKESPMSIISPFFSMVCNMCEASGCIKNVSGFSKVIAGRHGSVEADMNMDNTSILKEWVKLCETAWEGGVKKVRLDCASKFVINILMNVRSESYGGQLTCEALDVLDKAPGHVEVMRKKEDTVMRKKVDVPVYADVYVDRSDLMSWLRVLNNDKTLACNTRGIIVHCSNMQVTLEDLVLMTMGCDGSRVDLLMTMLDTFIEDGSVHECLTSMLRRSC